MFPSRFYIHDCDVCVKNDRFRRSAPIGGFERPRSQKVSRISKWNQHLSGEALSAEQGYNRLLANGIDLMELQQHYKSSIYVVFTWRIFIFALSSDSKQVILTGTASLIPIQ
jgi:hypothetical protein